MSLGRAGGQRPREEARFAEPGRATAPLGGLLGNTHGTVCVPTEHRTQGRYRTDALRSRVP